MKISRAASSLFWCATAARAAFDTGRVGQLFRHGEKRSNPLFDSLQFDRPVFSRSASGSKFANSNTTQFAVDGSSLPLVSFNAGESYAGLLPIGDDSDGKLFFWFWPTTASDEPQEIIIWLNGGPGCSSLEGLLQENGPISWQAGTFEPVSNPWSWHRLSNVIYVESPIGTGFSSGTVTATDEDDIARQFMGFWKNFVDTFSLQGYQVYVTGESYAGMYCPYIASNMLDANDTTYFNVKGMMINDPVISDPQLVTSIPSRAFAEYWAPVFPFNDSTWSAIDSMSQSCGYDDYLYQYLTFPPSGEQPAKLPGYVYEGDVPVSLNGSCDVYDLIYGAANLFNPGFNIYQVAQLLPIPDDPLGFPDLTAQGQQAYFNRTDVKTAIHAPQDVDWTECTDSPVFVGGSDNSEPSMFGPIPNVIGRTGNVMISHGVNDMVLIANGTLLAIQNMTWGGQRGFQDMPTDPLFVPLHDNPDPATASGSGILGTTHSERGLTWAYIVLTGHMIPGWQAAASFRQVEFLLGRVSSLSSTQPLSIYPDAGQPSAQSLGRGTAPPLGRLLNSTGSGSGSGNGSGGGSCSSNGKSSLGSAVGVKLGQAVTIISVTILALLA